MDNARSSRQRSFVILALVALALHGAAVHAAYVEVRTYVNNDEYGSRQSP